MTAHNVRRGDFIRSVMGFVGILKQTIPLLALVCLVWLSLPWAAHGQSTATSQIVFGVREDTAPFAYREGSEFKGYTVDLCHKVFEQYKQNMGDPNLELKMIPVDAETRFDALKEKRIQALCGATTVTIERMKDHHFTLLTYLSGASVMKRLDTKVDALSKPRDNEGIKVSVVANTTTEGHVRDLLGVSVSIIEKANHLEAFKALQERKVDFYFGDRMILRERLRGAPDRDVYVLAPGFLSYEPYAIAIQKDNEELLQAANAALAALYRSEADTNRIYQRWFGSTKMSDLLKAMYVIQKIPLGKVVEGN